jgi:hypothetical protein
LWTTGALLGLGVDAAAVADPAGRLKPRLELRLWARPRHAHAASRVLLATCHKSLDLRPGRFGAGAVARGHAPVDPRFAKAMLLEGSGGKGEGGPVEMALLAAFLDVAAEPPEYLAARE